MICVGSDNLGCGEVVYRCVVGSIVGFGYEL